MPIKPSTKDIVRGIVVSFDVFEKEDIKKVNQKVNETFGFKPSIQKAGVMGTPASSYEVTEAVWNVESLPKLFETLKHVCDEKGFTCNLDMIKRYVESFQVRGYDSPRLQFYILMARVSLRKDALNSCKDLRGDLWQVALPLRLFVQSYGGLTDWMSSFSPRSSVVTQLWVKVGKDFLSKMRKTEIALIGKNEETFEIREQRKKLNKDLRSLEPFDLSAKAGDIHSHILNGENVAIIIGHMEQLALGGLRTPYITYLSYDENLLKSDVSDLRSIMIGVPTYGLQGIFWQGYANLIGLISMLTYLNHIAVQGARIDSQLSVLRDSITTKSSEHAFDQMFEHFSEFSNYGTQISSLSSVLGAFSRQWESTISRISGGKDVFALEVPIESDDFFGQINTLSNLGRKGFLGTLASQILQTLENSRESLAQQKSEIASLRMHISDVVNLKISRSNENLQRNMLKISKSNENLQKSMKRLTIISIVIAVIALVASITSGWYGYRIAASDYERAHPDGTYFVHVYFLGYDYPTNTDHFRITATYQGRGESKYLRLSVGIVGANPVVVSKGNMEVMEPDIILARDYVDGLIGWVDYNIRRILPLNRTELNIYDFNSDVDAEIIYNP